MLSLIYIVLGVLSWSVGLTILLPWLLALFFSLSLRSVFFSWVYSTFVTPLARSKLDVARKKPFHILKDYVKISLKPLEILEIGVAQGPNLEFYPNNCNLTVLDKNKNFEPYFLKNLKKCSQVSCRGFITQCAEDMKDVVDESFDVVISTFLHCSTSDSTAVLREIKRVLKPSYIACSWSTSHIGLVAVFYGATFALSSIISGLLIKLFGRKIILTLCQIVNMVCLALLYLWIPDPQHTYMVYLASGTFGFIVGIFHTQTKALYGIFFGGDEETAFSSCNLYSSIGWVLPFVYSEILCTSVKIWIMFIVACLGLVGYLLAERSFNERNKQTYLLK